MSACLVTKHVHKIELNGLNKGTVFRYIERQSHIFTVIQIHLKVQNQTIPCFISHLNHNDICTAQIILLIYTHNARCEESINDTNLKGLSCVSKFMPEAYVYR